MSEAPPGCVRLLLSHGRSDVQSVAVRLRDLFASPEMRVIHEGWAFHSLQDTPDLPGQCITALRRPNHFARADTAEDVQSLCKALASLQFQTSLNNVFGGTAVEFYADPNDNGILGRAFVVQFAVETLQSYHKNHWLAAQFVLHQAGALGFIARNPSKWVKGFPKGINDTAATIAKCGAILECADFIEGAAKSLHPKGKGFVHTLGGHEEKVKEIKNILVNAFGCAGSILPISVKLKAVLDSSTVRENMAAISGSFFTAADTLHSSLQDLILTIDSGPSLYKTQMASITMMIRVGEIFPISLDVTDDAFADTFASAALTAVFTGATTACYLLGGPVHWLVRGALASTSSAYHTGRKIPEWWRARGLSIELLVMAGKIISCAMLLRILALRNALQADSDGLLEDLLKERLNIDDYAKLRRTGYVCARLKLVTDGLKKDFEAMRSRFKKLKFIEV